MKMKIKVKSIVNDLDSIVHTGDVSPQSRLGDVWTCGTILASAYILHCLSAM